jgi:phosphoenolpyruvate carboxykinase (GTP)
MCERVDGKVGAQKSPIGLLPLDGDLDLSGLALPGESLRELMSVNTAEWKAEIPDIADHFASLGSRLPEKLKIQFNDLKERLR